MSGFVAGCCFGAVAGAFGGWFFGGGGLYILVAVFPVLDVGRELFCCGAFFTPQLVLAVVGWTGRLLPAVVLGPGGCGVTGSSLVGRSLVVEAW